MMVGIKIPYSCSLSLLIILCMLIASDRDVIFDPYVTPNYLSQASKQASSLHSTPPKRGAANLLDVRRRIKGCKVGTEINNMTKKLRLLLLIK